MLKVSEWSVIMTLVVFLSACSGERSGNPLSPINPDTGNPGAELRGLVSVSIDDGWRSTYTNAFPILDGAGLKSTSYIITGRFNDPNYIGTTEILDIQSRGHEVGAHTRTHRDLVPMTSAQLQAEISGSKADLLGIGVRSVETFAYPFGSYNGTVIQLVRDAGFIGARTASGGFNLRTTDKFALNRHNLGNTTSIAQVQGWLDTAITDNTWLILVAHHIDQTNTEYSITPEFFRDVISEIKRRRIRTATISEGVRIMN